MRKRKFGFCALIAAFSMVFAAPVMAETTENVQGSADELPVMHAAPDTSGLEAIDFSLEEWEVLYLTNAVRLENDLEPVSVFKELQDAANVRKSEIESVFSHTRPDNTGMETVLSEKNVAWDTCGENIAKGQDSSTEVINAWWNSDGHRSNILNSEYTHMAAGFSYTTNYPYWLQLFTGSCEPTSINLLLDTDVTYLMESDETVDDLGVILEVTCEHGKSYLPVLDEMCTYDGSLWDETQDIQVSYRGLSTTFRVSIVEEMPFTDVGENEWFYDYVANVYYNGIMTGLNDTKFGPYESLSRAQFAVILYRLQGEPEVTYNGKFPDVPGGIWFTDAVAWANQYGIITGYSNGTFGPADYITREQMALMMYRYASALGCDTSQREDFSRYKDAARVSSFAKEAMQWAVANRIITGKYNETALEPQGTASRAECATVISRFIFDYLYNQI